MTAGLAVNLIALGVLTALLLWWARRPTEAVRLRNAMRLQPSRDEDFTWTPPHFPPGFAVERRAPDTEFREIVTALGIDAIPGDWNKALTLAGHLTERAEDKGAVQADPLTTYRAIRDGHGYCADFVKVFLVLAHAAGLVARQWGFSFDGFGGHGHAVVEVFDRDRGRWLLLDVFNNFHVVDAASGEPLSALEYRDALLVHRGAALMRRNGPGRPGYVLEHKAVGVLAAGIDQWYLVWGNAVARTTRIPRCDVRAVSRARSHTLRPTSLERSRISASTQHPRTRGDSADVYFAPPPAMDIFAGLVLLVALAVQLMAGGVAGRAGA